MTWQPVAILYPDAELATIGLLRSLLAAEGETDVKVIRTMPSSRPPRCVQVIRDGGSVSNLRYRARLRFLVWDTSYQKAVDLARLVAALAMRMVGQSGVLHVEHLSGPYEIPETGAFKQYLLIEVHYRGEALA